MPGRSMLQESCKAYPPQKACTLLLGMITMGLTQPICQLSMHETDSVGPTSSGVSESIPIAIVLHLHHLAQP